MTIREQLTKELGIYFDPNKPIKEMLDGLDKSGRFDTKTVRIFLGVMAEALDKVSKDFDNHLP